MSGGSIVVVRATRDAVVPTRAVPPAAVQVAPGLRRRPRHRRSRLIRRAGWSGLALVVLASPVAWSQGRSWVDPAVTGDAVALRVDVPTVHTAQTARCWDGTAARSPKACSTPQGRAGLATVFPAITAACHPGAATRRGVAEAYLCPGAGYVVRYTRWVTGFDRFTPLDRVAGSTGTRWTLAGGAFAGRAWSSTADGASSIGDARPYRWTATYRAVPFSVEVLAADPAARTAGTAAVRVARPAHVGRAR